MSWKGPARSQESPRINKDGTPRSFPRKLDFYSIILSFHHRVLKDELYINIFYIILKGIQSIVFLYTFYVPLYWNEIDL